MGLEVAVTGSALVPTGELFEVEFVGAVENVLLDRGDLGVGLLEAELAIVLIEHYIDEQNPIERAYVVLGLATEESSSAFCTVSAAAY